MFENKTLEGIRSSYCVSIYTPVYNNHNKSGNNESKLNKLKNNIRNHLETFELSEEQIKNMLELFDNFIQTNKTFRYPINTLVVFFSDKGLVSKTYQEELALSEVFVEKDFVTEKLNKLESSGSDCFILKLYQDEAKLYKNSSGTLTELSLTGLNKTFKALYEDIEVIQNIQFHITSSGASTIMNHGHRDEDKFLEDKLKKYVKNIETEVSKYLSKQDEKLPLILASSPKIAGIYRECNSYDNLFENLVSINHKHSSADDLKIKAEKYSLRHVSSANRFSFKEII